MLLAQPLVPFARVLHGPPHAEDVQDRRRDDDERDHGEDRNLARTEDTHDETEDVEAEIHQPGEEDEAVDRYD